ncbi:MAG TPA: hypothetical protein VIJ27_03415 [Mucilaginibacter sp.]
MTVTIGGIVFKGEFLDVFLQAPDNNIPGSKKYNSAFDFIWVIDI